MFHAINFLTPVTMVIFFRLIGINEFKRYFSIYIFSSIAIGIAFLLFMPSCMCANLFDKITGSLVLVFPLSLFFILLFFLIFYFARKINSLIRQGAKRTK